ncbi:L,D-transpeptidase [Phyllobacterium phragmitis]|uniref:L,D-transpeptidase n=1 Tax=Phyllobacterium phragmitis TaxID=2670329 RepID=A0A2S9IQZ9_9HYPH|nr:L,D-transpeptidase [Phyllobacterium phragmitis]PRD42948.1 L,D-transpeptidase [Phyllobacterium phragmitis]
MSINRRSVIVGLPFALGGCITNESVSIKPQAFSPVKDQYYRSMYGSITSEPWPIAAVDLTNVNPKFFRQEVSYASSYAPGTVVVDPNERFAYLVGENDRALRYGVGVGKVEAFNFQGEATIAAKKEWPGWRPTPDMIAREPDRYGPLKGGLPGGPRNPLGPRALYLFRNGQDTFYRLHGTVEPWTIGTKVSSGCIRLFNQDIIDLYSRVPAGTKAVVLPTFATDEVA